MERRLAAILSADLAGYSRLIAEDETGTLFRLRKLRQGFLEPLIARHGGRIVKLMGDGLLLEFSSIIEAVQCAIEWHEVVANFIAEQDGANDLAYRIGVNIGDIVIEDGDIYGDGVNIAARMEKLAEPGGTCLPGDVYRQIKGKIDATFDDLGEHTVKNIAEPLHIYALHPAHGEQPAKPLQRQKFDRPSIAVLPLDNLSSDPEQDYFADGVTEDIITNLSRFRELVVIGQSSSFRYKKTRDSFRQIATALGVQYLLIGSLRRAGQRLRVTVQLVDTRSGGHIWAERYDRELGDLFALQDEITEAIVQTLVGRLRTASVRDTAHKPAQSLDAYDYVLKARAIIHDSRENMLKSRALYEKAIELDPICAHAFAGLSATYSFEWTSGWSKSFTDSLDKAIELCRRAAALDDQDSEAQRRLGVYYLFRGEREKAEAHIQRAALLNPSDADTMAYKGLYLIYDGKPTEGLRAIERATRYNPFHPTWYFWLVSLAHYMNRDYEEAIQAARKAVQAYPDFVAPHRHLAASFARLGRKEDAEREKQIILKLDPAFSIARVARAFAYRRSEDLEHYCEGLREAGLPE
ncbi:adenylate/guanylate cyclase domain-containing protein [Rhizobiales bacterium]|uniref:adenylate/guanylate cyclase domain-containing protein n=1 Tax=Hongsoonwoonella zoysiae TaxID=2821844 RepID=UPI0015614A86|nr:adenylate/guanylate cyclase domain-containing protein [Hongsoonwoonella zoysiae]NRG16200.1 adenylate/guanylate cyclase domain-containing protein [Hongsoonwoonella zoysiae]